MNDLENVQRTKSSLALAAEIEAAVLRLTLRQVEVRSIESVGDPFRLVTLAGESLQGRSWTPGDMLQVAFPGWQSRAYTPYAFDPARGTALFLGYVHGHGIGSAWLAAARVGESRFVLGPRGAVNLSALQRPLLFFGDETSFSTAAALQATPLGLLGVQLVFEVSSLDASRAALERLGIAERATLIQREAEDAHFERLEAALLAAFEPSVGTRCILTGAAASIKRMYKAARRAGVPSKQVTNLAYWAPGRKGFSGVQR
jgi:ferric-chelate reductase (NADPH)